MKTIQYFFGSAFRSIWLEKWINLLTILSISIGLSILCIFTMITFNIETFMQRWSSSFGLVVYLDENITNEEIYELEDLFSRDRDISNVSFISNVDALNDVKESLGTNAVILDGFDENPLPSSFELQLAAGLLDQEAVSRKAASISRHPLVSDVQYGEKWLASLNAISDTLKMVALFFASAILIATIFTTYNTIKLFFYRRKDELMTLKLLGATNTFTRTPFLIEGLFVGAMGGTISSILVFTLSSFTTNKLVEFMPYVTVVLSPLPVEAYLLIPALGAFISLMGSFMAVGRIRY